MRKAMKLFLSEKKRDQWVDEYLKNNPPGTCVVSGGFPLIHIFTAIVLQTGEDKED